MFLTVMMVCLAAACGGPLLLLGLYVVADRLGWRIADRILTLVGAAFVYQIVVGCLVNIALGIALVGSAVWVAFRSDLAWRVPLAALVIALGVWRAAKGTILLRSAWAERSLLDPGQR